MKEVKEFDMSRFKEFKPFKLRSKAFKNSGFRWWFRVQMHYVVGEFLRVFAKFMVHRFVAEKKLCEMKLLNNTYSQDRYTYCKESTKKFCPVGKPATHMLYIHQHGYVFRGNSELECYLTCLFKMYAPYGYMVFPAYPRWKKRKEDEK